VRQGKLRYLAASNFSGLAPFRSPLSQPALWVVALCRSSVYYSLVGRDYEWELIAASAYPKGLGALIMEPAGLGTAHGQ
jgi:aryl-alcohol dehydrogenase-like predicted oxidoreductase